MELKGELWVEIPGVAGKASLRFAERAADVHVETVFVPVAARGTGVGTALLKRVFDLADAARKPVVLEARPIGSRGPEAVARLVNFYERLGFVVENPNFSSPSMRRPPRS